jgi:8-oxo-dGTP diphosphatase
MPISDYLRNLRDKVGHDLVMVPSVAAVIRNDSGEVLLHRRTDNGQWSIIGGALDPGEHPAEAIVREVEEETGLKVVPVRITGVYGGQNNISSYPNGDQIAVTNITFECHIVGGEISIDNDESLEVRFFPAGALPASLPQRHRERIEHALTHTEPFFYFSG